MKKHRIYRLTVITIGFFAVVSIYAAALGNVGRVCLFSAISGTITLDGKPVVNVRLVRIGDRGGLKMDEILTDKDGYFSLPAMYERTITKFIPQEFVASQKIIVHYSGLQYEIWNSVKRSPEENSESKGKPLLVVCELNSEEKSIIVDRVPIHSLCTWDVDPDREVNWEKDGFFDK